MLLAAAATSSLLGVMSEEDAQEADLDPDDAADRYALSWPPGNTADFEQLDAGL